MQNLHKGLFGSTDDEVDTSSWRQDPDGASATPSAASGSSTVGYGDLGVIDGASRGGSSGGTTTSGTTLAASATQVTTAGSGLVINLNWDSSVASAPAGFMTDVQNAAAFLESQITTTATVNIDVGYNEIGGSSLGSGALGESETYLTSVSYAALVSALKATASTDATDASLLASLPASAPVSGTFWITTAQAKALGLSAATGTSLDAYVGFGVGSEFTFGLTNTSGTVTSGTYDFFATAVHEITETMGRQMLVGTTALNGAAAYSLMDLTHYSSAGVRDFTQSTPGYNSADGGVTSLGADNTIAGGDAGDWASSVGPNALNAFASPGVLEPMTANDLALMDTLGWNLSGGTTTPPAPPPPPPPAPAAPTGVSIAVNTAYLSSLQGSNGLNGGRPIATFTETGGVSGDKFSYSLGGAGASSFTMSSSGVLSTGSHGVTGGTNGVLKALTVTATDVTTSSTSSSPAIPINVVIGGSGGDTINLASIGGIVAAAPTFIYGIGGADTINGAGMTGTLYFDAGTGADRMTGGSGHNVYEYGAASDSTASAMDIISNFNTATDRIDLTGLSSRFSSVAALSTTATTLAAGAIGWQVSGGNTFVYANTSGRTESLGSTNMKIELQGAIALTAANISHN
jgi:Peptidase M10 serralysin C terminal